MTEPEPDHRGVHQVSAQRISTTEGATERSQEEVSVVREGHVTIDVGGVDAFTLLCIPNDRRALVAGFLLSEGLIESMADVARLEPCEDDPNIMRVALHGGASSVGDPGRNLLISSSCGACGSEHLDTRIAALPEVSDNLRIPGRVLRAACRSVRDEQVLFTSCGGTHAAGIFTRDGEVIACAEDTGRHNALDKAIGKCLLAGRPTAGLGVVLSGRVSLEMVGKCARAGIEVIAAISAPTSLAIEVAEHCGITLCAFVRETRATVFTGPHRIVLPS